MTSLSADLPARPAVLPIRSSLLWTGGTIFLSLLVLWFVGADQGALSIFGSDVHVHEYVHDARHFLGFPCH